MYYITFILWYIYIFYIMCVVLCICLICYIIDILFVVNIYILHHMYLILNLCLSYTQLYSYNFGNVILPYIYISKYLYLDICNHMSLYSKGKGFPHGGLGALLLTPRRCCSGGWCDLHINPNIIPYVYIYIYTCLMVEPNFVMVNLVKPPSLMVGHPSSKLM